MRSTDKYVELREEGNNRSLCRCMKKQSKEGFAYQ
jgi:hypothetical protein